MKGLKELRRTNPDGSKRKERKKCENCKCERYNPCNCMKKKDADK